jgi:hypothetical protein
LFLAILAHQAIGSHICIPLDSRQEKGMILDPKKSLRMELKRHLPDWR